MHGVHFGRYLNNPEDIVFPALRKTFNFSDVIFPQDIRNCVKCHDPKGSPMWKQEPSRLACMACHDSDAANGHAKLMTVSANPPDPWSADNVETREVCHGAGKEFSPDKVHNIANPYKPPYPREPEGK